MRLAILGLGLIGGSLALALRRARPAWRIVGWDRDAEALRLALAREALDLAAADPAAAVLGADLVVLATPVCAIASLFEAIAPALRPGTIVTDVASTKQAVSAWARDTLPAHVHFVGGHPMAGSERSGMAAARRELFAGAVYCLTPAPGTAPAMIETLAELALAVGARPWVLDAERHDAYVAAISHVPFLAACLLVDLTASAPDWKAMQRLAASGYRDATRLASGDPAMYRDICLTNAAAIRPWLSTLASRLLDLEARLDDPAAMTAFFQANRDLREAWLAESQAAPLSPLPGGGEGS